LGPGDARGAVASRDQELIAPPIALKGGFGGVGFFAVRFDYQPLLVPKHVDFEAVSFDLQPDVRTRGRQALFDETGEKASLEPTSQ
jgi:hypothetical protein